VEEVPLFYGPLTSKLGTILTNAHGYTAYLFTDDHDSSRCSGACAKAWPPLLGGAVAARSGVNSHLLRLTTRPGVKVALTGLCVKAIFTAWMKLGRRRISIVR
jgi:hypothetical protein